MEVNYDSKKLLRMYSKLLLDLDKQHQTCINKYIILYFYSLTVMLVWSRRAIKENLRIQRSCQESEQLVGTNFSQNSKPYIVLELPCDPHDHSSSCTQCLFVIGLHQHNVCSPLVTAYTQVVLVF